MLLVDWACSRQEASMNSKVTNGKRGHYQPPEMMKGQVIRHATYALHFTPDPIHSMSCALGPLEQRSTAACDILFSLSLVKFATISQPSRRLRYSSVTKNFEPKFQAGSFEQKL